MSGLSDAAPPRRILAVKLADFGDALLTTPALAALRAAWPDARLDVLTTPQAAAVYHHTGLVDAIIPFAKADYDRPGGLLARPGALLALARRLRGGRYDRVVLFHPLTTRFGALKHAALTLATGAPIRAGLARPGSPRAWFLTHRAPDRGFARAHVVEQMLGVAAALGAPAVARRLVYRPGPAAETAAEVLARAIAPEGRLVLVHPGCGPFGPARRWSAAGFAAVCDALAADGHAVALVGTAADGAAAVMAACARPPVDLTDRTDLPTLAALLARAAVLVSNDGGVMHLATAVGTPVVAVFGPSSAAAWGPWWPSEDGPSPHAVVALDLPCRPCFYVGYRLGSPTGCATRDCLRWLPAPRVIDAARRALARGQGGAI